jgi:hypothetical protein
MDAPEVPLEQSQEEIAHHAHHATEPWIMGVALTAALLAALAAVTALLAEHHANEAMILQIQCSDQWNFYQAKSLKANLLTAKMELLAELGKKAGDKDAAKLDQYEKDRQKIKHEAEDKQRESEVHLRHHTLLACSLTMFQLAIAVAAISVLTKRKGFWFACMGFGLVGLVLLMMTLGMGVFGGLLTTAPR